MINISGKICTKDSDIEDTIVQHFKDIYTATRKEQLFVDNIDWASITKVSRNMLDRSFDDMKVWQSLKSFDNNKAPCSNGFTMEFLKKAWNLMKNNIMDIFKDFHSNKIINKVVNETYIPLIAKKKKVKEQWTTDQLVSPLLFIN